MVGYRSPTDLLTWNSRPRVRAGLDLVFVRRWDGGYAMEDYVLGTSTLRAR